ncbi:hypothetical protein F966_01977 [Acinetobacter higginsii]|uniref:Uncharacterized protein n=1 Tax=Acinetobacter higginsii TaxID=70347 RepID=N8WBM2_9GAMM|nr:hypothetical protein [Acinetobacter higginsii]ENV09321.1 hypothetical protein F966_01977 [Acinetobacter higginsii]
MYKLNISTPAFFQASLPISMEVGEFLINRLNQLDSQTIHRDELQQKMGYPIGVGSNSGSFLNNVYNFANAILKESNAEQFKVEIEAIPAHQKIDSIFSEAASLPEHGRSIVVVFKDKQLMSDVEYCKKCKEWHSPKGDLKAGQIHQWAYTEDFYNLLNLPEFPEAKTNNRKSTEDIAADLAHLFLLKALLGAAKSGSESSRSFF